MDKNLQNRILFQFSCGLGNQMFQYAFYKRLLCDGRKIFAEKEYYNNSNTKFLLDKIFNLDIRWASKDEMQLYNESPILQYLRNNRYVRVRRLYGIVTGKKYKMTYSNNASLFDAKYLIKKKGYFIGFWQNIKYFINIDEEIRKDYVFPAFIDEKNKSLEKIIRNTNSVSVHIRRGDYVELDSRPNEISTDKLVNKVLWRKPIRTRYALCSKQYFQNAIELISNKIANPYFVVFSDDIEWCRQNLNISNGEYVDWNHGNDSYKDMQLMSECKHNIICNSTFSWWGAYLNKNMHKIVIAPKYWFKIDGKLFESDIVPEKWIKI